MRLNRRSWAALLAAVLVVALGVVALREPVPYVTFAPGPTVNVLGSFADKPVITVSGRRAYSDKGALRLLTVEPSGPDQKVGLPELIWAWADPTRSVYPYEAIYQRQDTQKTVQQQSGVQMASSQDNAVAAALRALGIRYADLVKIVTVQKGGPADGRLRAGDVVVAVGPHRIHTVDELTRSIRPLPVGSSVTMRVRRGGKVVTERMTTTSSPVNARESAVRVTISAAYRFPFRVRLNLDKNIGGPSGGLIFALGVYDVLTPGSLTAGKVVAGTGEIDAAGRVGPIGGVQQKMVGAQDAGAQLFLVPAANCSEALDGHYDPAKMRLVKVATLAGALADVKAWAASPDAPLPRCTR